MNVGCVLFKKKREKEGKKEKTEKMARASLCLSREQGEKRQKLVAFSPIRGSNYRKEEYCTNIIPFKIEFSQPKVLPLKIISLRMEVIFG